MNRTRPLTLLISNLQHFADMGVIFLAGYLTLHFRFWQTAAPNDFYDKCIFGACLIFLFLSSNIFRSNADNDFLKSITRVTRLWIICFFSVVLIILFTQSGNLVSRIWLGSWALVAWILLVCTHIFIGVLLQRFYLKKLNKKRVAIIGSGDIAQQLIGKLENKSVSEFELVRHVNEPEQSAVKALGEVALDEIWIALPIQAADQLERIVADLQYSAANIKYVPDLFTLRLINHGSTEILGVEMLNLNATPFSGEALLLKNTEDIVFSTLILIAFSPLILFLALGVKLSSPGPIFYRQERVGLNGRPFMMLKFRSMPVDTEKDGAQWGGSNSKVVHPFSKWMRRLNLDEIPQFINVLKGEMSIVGPRPERSEFIDQFKDQIPDYMKKHLVKAGITGWAQVHGLRGDTGLHQRIEYDLYYIENWSLKLDIKIILMTVIGTLLPHSVPKP